MTNFEDYLVRQFYQAFYAPLATVSSLQFLLSEPFPDLLDFPDLLVVIVISVTGFHFLSKKEKDLHKNYM